MGMLTRYQTLPSEPTCLRTARISCGRKSGRKSCSTLITLELGFGVLRMATEWTVNWPAAGKTDSTRVRDETERDVVVVVAPAVLVVAVEPAEAREGSTTAAANPATARRTATVRTRRLTRLRRRQ